VTQLNDAPGCIAIEDGIDNKDIGGFLTVEVIRDGKNGPEVTARRKTHNLIVNTGKQQVWRMATGLNAKIFDVGRIGTSGAAAAVGNTNVLSPVTGTIQTVDSLSLLSGTRTIQIVWSYPSGAGSTSATGISEAVLLNQCTSPGGSALMRAVFTSVELAALAA